MEDKVYLSCRGFKAITNPIVVQFGLDISFDFFVIIFSLIPYTTRGTSSFIRKTDELSITNEPLSMKLGAKSLDLSPPAENSEMLYSPIFSLLSSLTVISLSWIFIFFPSEDFEAKSEYSTFTSKYCSHKFIIFVPTRPVAPTIAIFILFL